MRVTKKPLMALCSSFTVMVHYEHDTGNTSNTVTNHITDMKLYVNDISESW